MSDRLHYETPVEAEKRSAPAALRNVGAIGDVLAEWLPAAGMVLELASGTGEHGVAFARRFPGINWQPSDAAEEALASIAAWRGEGPPNLLAPVRIDAAEAGWPVDHADAVVAINLLHISPWATALGLLDEAARLLAAGAPLILYGPWIEEGVATVPSNQVFDLDLRARDPRWGLRQVADFAREAEGRGLLLGERRAMPANNIMLRFDRH